MSTELVLQAKTEAPSSSWFLPPLARFPLLRARKAAFLGTYKKSHWSALVEGS